MILSRYASLKINGKNFTVFSPALAVDYCEQYYADSNL